MHMEKEKKKGQIYLVDIKLKAARHQKLKSENSTNKSGKYGAANNETKHCLQIYDLWKLLGNRKKPQYNDIIDNEAPDQK